LRWDSMEGGRSARGENERGSRSVSRQRSVSRDGRCGSTDARYNSRASRGRTTNSYARPGAGGAPDTFDDTAVEKIKELETQVEGLQRLNLVLRSELPSHKADVAAEHAARMRQSSARRGAKDESRQSSFRARSLSRPRSREPSEGIPEDFGPHNRRCNSSSPMRSGFAAAGKPRTKHSPRPVREIEPLMAKSLPSPRSAAASVDTTEFPKGRKVLIDKNAPSEHWMASISSDTRSEIKYDWQHGHPNIEWKRKVPDAIPVRPRQDKRQADPQGRPWVRQFSSMAKNMHSDPWVFQDLHAKRPDGSQFHDRDLFEEPQTGKRLFRNPTKNAHTWQPQEEAPMAGKSSREVSPRPFSRTTRKQFFDSHRNRPSDIFFSPMGADAPGAPYWSERTTPRSLSPTPSAWRNTARYQPMPGDRGLSPITGQPRAVGPERPMREAVYAR